MPEITTANAPIPLPAAKVRCELEANAEIPHFPAVTVGPWDIDGTRTIREQYGPHVDVVTIERHHGETLHRDVVVGDLSKVALTPAQARQLADDLVNAADHAEAEWVNP